MDYENDTAWVRKMLYPGENLLWTGQPGKIRIFEKKDIPPLIFGIIWLCFAGMASWKIWTSPNRGFSSKLFIVAFLLVGLFSLTARYIVKLQTRKARYALTSQRIITKVSNRIRTLDLCNLPPITVSQKADGTGDIRFGETVSSQRNASGLNFGSTRSYSTGAVLELQSIPDVNRVEYRIRTAVEQALAARRSN